MKAVVLYLIQSPLQALNAIEAASRHSTHINIMVIAPSLRKKNDQQMIEIIKLFKWDRVIYFSLRKKNNPIYRMLYSFFFIWTIRFYYKKRIMKIFVGDFRSIWTHDFISILQPKKYYLLDDGLSAITIQNMFIKDGSYKNLYSENSNFKKLIKEKIRNVVFLHKKNNFIKDTPAHLFTVYDIHPLPQQRVIKNDYSFFKKPTSNKKLDKKTVFHFGSKYSEIGIINFEFEIEFLQKITNFYRSKEIIFIYIPHREDSIKKISTIKEKLKVQIKYLEVPAEQYFFMNKEFPAHISGAYTSVLLNLANIADFQSITAFYLPQKKIIESHKNQINAIYKHLQSKGINIINLC